MIFNIFISEKDTPKEPPRTYNLQSSTYSSPDITKQIGDGTVSRVQDPSLNLPELPTPNALMQSYLRRYNMLLNAVHIILFYWLSILFHTRFSKEITFLTMNSLDSDPMKILLW